MYIFIETYDFYFFVWVYNLVSSPEEEVVDAFPDCVLFFSLLFNT